jgi:hypothetical protein
VNAYDYANQDPVNGFDLGGECASGPRHSCDKHNKTGPIGESRHEARRVSKREHRIIVRDLARTTNPGRVVAIIWSKVMSQKKQESILSKALNAVAGAPHMTVHAVESAVLSVGARIVSALPDCAQTGAGLDVVSATTGSIAIGLAAVPGAQGAAGTIGLIGGGAGLAAVPFDVEGKEGNC